MNYDENIFIRGRGGEGGGVRRHVMAWHGSKGAKGEKRGGGGGGEKESVRRGRGKRMED